MTENRIRTQNPHITIGIIGHASAIQQIVQVIRSFPSFQPIMRTFEHEDEIPGLAQALLSEAEVLLLSGPHSHRKAKDALPPGMPVHYVPLTDAGLFRALFAAQRGNRLEAGISVDTLTEAMVHRTAKQLGMASGEFHVYAGPAYSSAAELAAYHSALYQTGASSVALTGVETAAIMLEQQGIPVERLSPTDQDIIVTLERALLSTETRRSKELQIVVGMINVDNFGKIAERRGTEHEVQKFKLDIHRMMLDYVESLDGYLSHLGGDDFLFFTTRGIFERETGGYKTIPLAKDALQSYGISLSMGIGFGTSANEAGTNARAALRKSKEAGGNGCFIVREDRTFIGPLEMAEPVESVLSMTDAALIKRAEDAGMTSAYLSKLLTHRARGARTEYKVAEVAALLQVTVRSAHRLLLMWQDNGLVEVAGMEKVPRGRPRQIFRFTFL
ncbi:hypothetical protein EBB07_06820 [Paenibacillaceae bacterium]|nr:hypothetical protein EBB07_06820 [Paenibacillaceae bacterium]